LTASLTYESFYGLREKPFSLSADPRFLFKSPAHAPAFDSLLAGIRRREGLIVLTGEIGTGKTTLCRAVLQHLDRRTFSAFVPDPFVSREDLLKTLLVDFGVISIGDLTRGRFNGASRSELSYPLYEFLDSLVPLQAFAVLVIDETQNLSLPLLEEIRILSELERREKLLQVVLVGQPELRANLTLPEMRQVDQRVSVRCELTALDVEGVAGYITHRLMVAGPGERLVEFSRAAIEAVYEGSGGVPRVINRLCDRALERAHAAQSRHIEAPFVWDAINDLGSAHAVSDRTTAKRPSSQDVGAPEASPNRVPIATAGAQTETNSALVEEFRSEAELSARAPSLELLRNRRRRAAIAVASIVAGASLGVPAWYLHARVVSAEVVATPEPPPPPHMFSAPEVTRPDVELKTETSPDDNGAAPGADKTAATAARYTILVASFTTPESAERAVAELTNAGYRAHAVDRDWGLPRGRLVQVSVGDYASAAAAQRALQQIRELPGGYHDARIIEHQ
jgi:type II secretory pathway predicted ATPase ExeA/cell division septation protein DedD